jgi:MFS family permease
VLGLALADDGDARTAILVGLGVYGLGQGGVSPVMFSTAISAVPLRSAGAASGVVATCNQVSAAIGVAVIGLVFQHLRAGGEGPRAYAWAAMGALTINFASMICGMVIAWRLPKPSAPVVVEPGPSIEP